MKALQSALEAAFARREALVTQLGPRGAYRLFCGEREGIRGLVVEVFADVAFFQVFHPQCSLDRSALGGLAHWALSRFGWRAVYLKPFVSDRSRQTARDETFLPTPLAGEAVEEEFPIREHGREFGIRPYAGYSVGLFLDQRENRKFLAERSGGKTVLNLFCYTGAFSVGAAASGASVTSVDLSGKYLEWARGNFERNGLALSEHRFLAEDATVYVQRAARRGERYDVVVVDPPTFARNRKRVFSVARDLIGLVGEIRRLLRPQGEIFVSTNFERWTTADLTRGLRRQFEGEAFRFVPLPAVPPDFRGRTHELSACLLQFS